MKYIHWFVWFLAGIILLLIITPAARADDVWLDTGFWSRHAQGNSHHYRQNNTGIGLETTLSESTSLHLGIYRNSLNKDGAYVSYAWQPLKVEDFKAGIAFTAATGYTKNGQWIFAPLPMLTWEHSRIGFNLIYAPSIVTSLQLKVKF
jgi:hypothetical protein